MHSIDGQSKVDDVANALVHVLSVPAIVLLIQKLPRGCEIFVQKRLGFKSSVCTYLQKHLFNAEQTK